MTSMLHKLDPPIERHQDSPDLLASRVRGEIHRLSHPSLIQEFLACELFVTLPLFFTFPSLRPVVDSLPRYESSSIYPRRSNMWTAASDCTAAAFVNLGPTIQSCPSRA
jgi:hypothetical protein